MELSSDIIIQFFFSLCGLIITVIVVCFKFFERIIAERFEKSDLQRDKKDLEQDIRIKEDIKKEIKESEKRMTETIKEELKEAREDFKKDKDHMLKNVKQTNDLMLKSLEIEHDKIVTTGSKILSNIKKAND